MNTVATRELQDARDIGTCLFISPFWGLIDKTSQGDLITYRLKLFAETRLLATSMESIVIDGALYERRGGYGYYFFSTKIDESCRADEDGYCDCEPHKYMPLTYRAGEICERCWLEEECIRGTGRDGCDHK